MTNLLPPASALAPAGPPPGLLLDALTVGVLALNQQGEVRQLNRQAAAWWGLPAAATLGQPLERLGPGHLPAAYAALRQAATGQSVPALRWHCHLVLDEGPPLPPSLQLAVYRLAQELAQNVVRHAQASEGTLEVEALPAWVVLRVAGGGLGFDPAATSDGLGLRTPRSRVALLGGSVHVSTAPGQGTQCQIRLPLTPIPAPV